MIIQLFYRYICVLYNISKLEKWLLYDLLCKVRKIILFFLFFKSKFLFINFFHSIRIKSKTKTKIQLSLNRLAGTGDVVSLPPPPLPPFGGGGGAGGGMGRAGPKNQLKGGRGDFGSIRGFFHWNSPHPPSFVLVCSCFFVFFSNFCFKYYYYKLQLKPLRNNFSNSPPPSANIPLLICFFFPWKKINNSK